MLNPEKNKLVYCQSLKQDNKLDLVGLSQNSAFRRKSAMKLSDTTSTGTIH